MLPSWLDLVRRSLSVALLPIAVQATAATLTVKVPGPLDPKGRIGCGLFAGESGFPMDNSVARMQWLPAQVDGVTCVFTDVADGAYALSVVLDMNGNQRVDTNFLGMPREAWGESNNARPSLRPPRFDEAVFKVTDGKHVQFDVRVAK